MTSDGLVGNYIYCWGHPLTCTLILYLYRACYPYFVGWNSLQNGRCSLLLGLGNAGKTTLLKQLAAEDIRLITPTQVKARTHLRAIFSDTINIILQLEINCFSFIRVSILKVFSQQDLSWMSGTWEVNAKSALTGGIILRTQTCWYKLFAVHTPYTVYYWVITVSRTCFIS